MSLCRDSRTALSPRCHCTRGQQGLPDVTVSLFLPCSSTFTQAAAPASPQTPCSCSRPPPGGSSDLNRAKNLRFFKKQEKINTEISISSLENLFSYIFKAFIFNFYMYIQKLYLYVQELYISVFRIPYFLQFCV